MSAQGCEQKRPLRLSAARAKNKEPLSVLRTVGQTESEGLPVHGILHGNEKANCEAGQCGLDLTAMTQNGKRQTEGPRHWVGPFEYLKSSYLWEITDWKWTRGNAPGLLELAVS